jgi:hypothetical protein
MIIIKKDGVKQLVRNPKKIKFYKKLVDIDKLPRVSYKKVR